MSTPTSSTSAVAPAATPAAAVDPSGITDHNFRRCLNMAVGTLLAEVGFESSSPGALETLTEALQSFLCELGRSCRAFTELACRNRPLPADILLALTEMGFRPEGLGQYAIRPSRRCLGNPGAAQPPKAASILHTGDRKRHRPGGVVPENFVELPDSHSYVRTPTHKQPVTDYESVRERAASQKRDVERALTRFVAKTGATHSLFDDADANLFPLISCDRVAPDQPILPAYVSALLFKDQLFEEDEREFAPKKKAKAEDQAGSGSKEAGGEKQDDEEKEVEEKAGKGKEEPDTIDNPFLRPPKMSRPPIMKRTL